MTGIIIGLVLAVVYLCIRTLFSGGRVHRHNHKDEQFHVGCECCEWQSEQRMKAGY